MSANAATEDSAEKLQLHGFNNLTKTLSFNIYDICYAPAGKHKQYLEYIDDAYNADRLTQILQGVADIIGATILNVAHQDYDPQGASVTMLIAEGRNIPTGMDLATPGPLPETVVAHLDKSHLTVHTYPESHPDNDICTFRVDIDVSTCGLISPLKTLNYLIHSFDSDIVILDYRVRGFTRDVSGHKHFIDHNMSTIQDYIAQDTSDSYQMIDVNVLQENIFHTKMMRHNFDLQNYSFENQQVLTGQQYSQVQQQLQKEMSEIFYGRNE